MTRGGNPKNLGPKRDLKILDKSILGEARATPEHGLVGSRTSLKVSDFGLSRIVEDVPPGFGGCFHCLV